MNSGVCLEWCWFWRTLHTSIISSKISLTDGLAFHCVLGPYFIFILNLSWTLPCRTGIQCDHERYNGRVLRTMSMVKNEEITAQPSTDCFFLSSLSLFYSPNTCSFGEMCSAAAQTKLPRKKNKYGKHTRGKDRGGDWKDENSNAAACPKSRNLWAKLYTVVLWCNSSSRLEI